MVTEWAGISSLRQSPSPREQPMRKVPGSIQTYVNRSREFILVRPAALALPPLASCLVVRPRLGGGVVGAALCTSLLFELSFRETSEPRDLMNQVIPSTTRSATPTSTIHT